MLSFQLEPSRRFGDPVKLCNAWCVSVHVCKEYWGGGVRIIGSECERLDGHLMIVTICLPVESAESITT